MKIFIFIFLLCCSNANGQALVNIQFYLDNQQVSTAAKDFYNKKFKANDNDKTLSIIDSLFTKNNSTRPFYIYLVSKMAFSSDGALSEAIGYSGNEFFQKKPNDLIAFLYSGNPIIDKSFLTNWAKIIAGEIAINCEGKEKNCLNTMKQSIQPLIKENNRQHFLEFYRLLENSFH